MKLRFVHLYGIPTYVNILKYDVIKQRKYHEIIRGESAAARENIRVSHAPPWPVPGAATEALALEV